MRVSPAFSVARPEIVGGQPARLLWQRWQGIGQGGLGRSAFRCQGIGCFAVGIGRGGFSAYREEQAAERARSHKRVEIGAGGQIMRKHALGRDGHSGAMLKRGTRAASARFGDRARRFATTERAAKPLDPRAWPRCPPARHRGWALPRRVSNRAQSHELQAFQARRKVRRLSFDRHDSHGIRPSPARYLDRTANRSESVLSTPGMVRVVSGPNVS